MIDEKALEVAAMANVVAVRGSTDVPAFDVCVRAEMDVLRPTIGLYESAKQPVRVDVGACVKAAEQCGFRDATGAHIINRTDAVKAVLAVVKDAAKEMGVELVYDQ